MRVPAKGQAKQGDRETPRERRVRPGRSVFVLFGESVFTLRLGMLWEDNRFYQVQGLSVTGLKCYSRSSWWRLVSQEPHPTLFPGPGPSSKLAITTTNPPGWSWPGSALGATQMTPLLEFTFTHPPPLPFKRDRQVQGHGDNPSRLEFL